MWTTWKRFLVEGFNVKVSKSSVVKKVFSLEICSIADQTDFPNSVFNVIDCDERFWTLFLHLKFWNVADWISTTLNLKHLKIDGQLCFEIKTLHVYQTGHIKVLIIHSRSCDLSNDDFKNSRCREDLTKRHTSK